MSDSDYDKKTKQVLEERQEHWLDRLHNHWVRQHLWAGQPARISAHRQLCIVPPRRMVCGPARISAHRQLCIVPPRRMVCGQSGCGNANRFRVGLGANRAVLSDGVPRLCRPCTPARKAAWNRHIFDGIAVLAVWG
jgi:hypothetical protein